MADESPECVTVALVVVFQPFAIKANRAAKVVSVERPKLVLVHFSFPFVRPPWPRNLISEGLNKKSPLAGAIL